MVRYILLILRLLKFREGKFVNSESSPLITCLHKKSWKVRVSTQPFPSEEEEGEEEGVVWMKGR